MGNTSGKKKDRRVGIVAAGQHGVVTAAQLRQLGLGERQIEYRLGEGRLEVVHRGVYRIAGGETTYEQRVMAACLATGGFASHRCAARLFGLRGFDNEETIEITVDGRRGPRLAGVVCHKAKDLPTTTIGVIPVTFPAQLLLDVAAVAPRRAEGALSHALIRDLVALGPMVRFLRERGRSGRPGVVRLRELVEAHVKGARPTESWLEDKVLEFLRAEGFPEPQRQYPLRLPGRSEPIRFDLAYPLCRGAVEADSRLWHSSPAEQQRDEERDRAAEALGWCVERVTWLQLREEPGEVVQRVRRLLAPPQPVLGSRTPHCAGFVTPNAQRRAGQPSRT